MKPVVALLRVLVGGLLVASPAVTFADEPVEIVNWTVPPYWSPRATGIPEEQPEGQGADSHVRLAEARRALTSGPTVLPFISIFPCRLVDTRGNGAPLTGGFLPSATVRSYTLTGVCNVPANAQAISLNATVVKPTGPGFLTLWPEGGAFPPVSTLNYLGNDVIVNAAVVPLSVTGGISIALGVSGGDVILDTNGYYAPQTLVSSLNTLAGDVTLAQGSNVTITPSGNTLTIAATSGSGGPPSGPAGGSLAGTYPNPTIASGQTITATLTGAASANVLKAGDTMTGTLNLSPGNINLATDPSTATSGNILKNGERFIHDFGSQSIFVGVNAGNFTMTGTDSNTAIGTTALQSLTTGSSNTAIGSQALIKDDAGLQNTAIGEAALHENAGGNLNTAIGVNALFANTGSGNTAIGWSAGINLTTGSNNIDIGVGNGGIAGESSTIRIGSAAQTRSFLAGVRGVTTGVTDGLPIVIDSNGQLGTASGSGGVITPAQLSAAGSSGGQALVSNGTAVSWGSPANFTGALAGEVTGTQSATVVSNATSANTLNAIVRRNGSGNFSAGTITAGLTGNVTGAASANVLKAGDTMTGTLTLNPGNINLVTDPSTLASGTILKNGSPFIHDAGNANSGNTFVGLNAGNFNMNFAATDNTALGFAALSSNTTGSANTASGVGALWLNTTGASSSAFGHEALRSNTTGAFNAAFGNAALANNTTGRFNSAFGNEALPTNTTGGNNVAFGSGALLANTTGDSNLAVGTSALYQSTGSANIALGTNAGFNLSSGSDNIDIGNRGIAGESRMIRIGTVGTHIATFIAGINGATVSTSAVFVNSAGQLGTITSSRRFKRDIRNIGESSAGLFQLRPVIFRYREELDPTGLEQYGLIAEEVAGVYPDLVVYDDDGQPQTVRYHFLVPMLLNEAQKQRQMVDALRDDAQQQSHTIERQSRSIEQLRGEIEALRQALTSLGRRAE